MLHKDDVVTMIEYLNPSVHQDRLAKHIKIHKPFFKILSMVHSVPYHLNSLFKNLLLSNKN